MLEKGTEQEGKLNKWQEEPLRMLMSWIKGMHINIEEGVCTCTSYLHLLICIYSTNCSEADPPPYKKPKTTSVVVEQAGTVDKLLIDQVTDAESVYEEVSIEQRHL